MAMALPGLAPDVERSFKEVLFRFLEEVHCTKAALYLRAPDSSFDLVAQYGFGRRERLAAAHQPLDPIVLKVRELRQRPLAVNHPQELPEVADYLQGAGSRRMLIVPLYGASRVLGFVDARDKGGQRPFESIDLRQASLIAGAFLRLLKHHQLYPDLDATEERPESAPLLRPSLGLSRLSGGALLDQSALATINDAAADAVTRDGLFGAAITVATNEVAATVVTTGASHGEMDTDAITRHQAEAFVRAGTQVPSHSNWRLELRRLSAASSSRVPSVIVTSTPLANSSWALAVSVIGVEGGQSPEVVLDRLCQLAVLSGELTALRFSRRALARRFLQPGTSRFPDLVAHSLAVSRLCWMMAQVLEFDDRSAEEAALAGLLHDVGMRELEYDRLYRHPAPSTEDRRTYRQHVVVGERLLRDAGMDAVSRAVRFHHERWDGKGYPEQLSGESIPLLARMVHVAEVFDVLTSTSSYRPHVPTDQALATMRAAAGQQFDRSLVHVLGQIVS